MSAQKVTAVFDIGKTNKKFFLFDSEFQEVYREYSRFENITDEDGHPTEDVYALEKWIKESFDRLLRSEKYDIQAINFSTYGASLVHLDENGNLVTPLYNYTKEIPDEVVASFYETYGPELELAAVTGSPKAGLLNSGIQLYWLKHYKPEVFTKIKKTLHLPQFISYLFTAIPLSEYTSIGCHTALWNYTKKDYHDWVYKEGFNTILPPIVSTETSININYRGKRLKIGVGIHDSSAALLPYVRSLRKRFVLVSTGTWSISLNPFSEGALTTDEISQNCLNYMRINGNPVKAARLFLGDEYSFQVREIEAKFGLDESFHRNVKFDRDIYLRLAGKPKRYFKWRSLDSDKMPEATHLDFRNAEDAYHQLMIELVELQVEQIALAAGEKKLKRIYIDGGFSDNDVFIKLLSVAFPDVKLRSTTSSLGSALGAAIAISDTKLDSKFLENNYSLTKHLPILFKLDESEIIK